LSGAQARVKNADANGAENGLQARKTPREFFLILQ
jgi:hypothetical protein